MSLSRNSNSTDTLTRDYTSSLYHKDKFTNTALRYAGTLNYRANNKNTIRAGFNASLLHYDLYALSYDTELAALTERINETGNTSTYNAFAQLKTVLNEKLTLNTGVHTNYFALSKSWSIEPRFGLNWHVATDQTISFGTGLYNRLEPLAYYFAKSSDQTSLEPNKALSPTKSAQAVIGYEKVIPKIEQ